MQISGQHRLSAPPNRVWDALHDVDVLRASVPGCQELEQTAPDVFSGAASVGVAVIKGLYRGSVTLLDEGEESFVKVAVQARSGHCEIKGEGQLGLSKEGAGTLLTYNGDAHFSGPLAAVGQRLLPSATRSQLEQFFNNLERKLQELALEQPPQTAISTEGPGL
jgi:carbon monoxide dehydrogenase subunit G